MATSISLPAEPFRRRVAVVILFVLAAIAALAFGAFQLSRSGLFHVRAIEVAGAGHLSESRVLTRAGVSEDTNVIWFDAAAAERRLEAHPWIADARVSTAFPATLRIVVVERIPVAVASDRLGDLLVSADGAALGPAGRVRGLPRIEVSSAAASVGPSRDAAAAIVGAMTPDLRARVRTVEVRADGSVELRLRGGVRVGYGSVAEPGRKAAVLERILEWADATGERVVRVSVAAPNAPAMRLAT